MIKGQHLIAGEWIDSPNTFSNSPVTGEAQKFPEGSSEQVNQAVTAAEEAFWSYSNTTLTKRASFLRNIAKEIDLLGNEITKIAMQETGLPEARLVGERARTTNQLLMFADYIETGEHLDKRHDEALPDRQPLPRPDLHLIQQAIGPVAVFGASNFPLAFSTAGGDTASALAAGCPVVVKGHSAHPGTGELVAQAIDVAIKKEGLHPGTFSIIQSNDFIVGNSLVQHPLIKAVAFTGSLHGGRVLFDLCANRPEPIPFFGELGSINPMFLLENALENRVSDIAEGWATALTMGAGQFCTNPGIIILKAGEKAERFIEMTANELEKIAGQTMLTDGIYKAYCSGSERLAKHTNTVFSGTNTQRVATPALYRTDFKTWIKNDELCEEVFGPVGLVVTVDSDVEMKTIAHKLEGQLTCTIHMNDNDLESAKELLPILQRKAGRILVNGFPTGVEVSGTMVHGGPYPATTNFGATSVGTMSIRRFLRPVCYQNFPQDLLNLS